MKWTPCHRMCGTRPLPPTDTQVHVVSLRQVIEGIEQRSMERRTRSHHETVSGVGYARRAR